MSRNLPDRKGRTLQISRWRLRLIGALLVLFAGLPTTTCYLEAPYAYQDCDKDEDCDMFPTTTCYQETFCACPKLNYIFCPGFKRCVPRAICLAEVSCDAGDDAGDGGGGGGGGGGGADGG